MSINPIKLVVVGQTGVGKTCIINRVIHDQFSENPPSTTASFNELKVNVNKGRTKVSLQIWDTAGQEKYRSIGKLFYTEAKVVMMVYDITKGETFEDIKKYWYGAVMENTDDVKMIYLIGNKSDLYESEDVKEDTAREYAKSINARFALTSALNGEGIQTIFTEIAEDFYRNFIKEKGGDDSKTAGDDYNIKIVDMKEDDKKKKKKCC